MLADSPTLSLAALPTDQTGADGTFDSADLPLQTAMDFSQGLQHLARGVTVVTTSDDDGEWYGVTTTSVCALSVDPPTLVACVRRRSRIGTQLGRTGRFCVNVLSQRQRRVAEVFAGLRGVDVDRFRHGTWAAGTTGSPVLEGARATFECAVDLIYGYPNHLVVIGSVRNSASATDPDEPLIYLSQRFGGVTPSDTETTSVH